MTTNIELEKYAEKHRFKNFRGVIFTDKLSKMKPKTTECGILGSRSSKSNEDMHWTCWFKFKNKIYAFDSYGLEPDDRLTKYLKNGTKTNVLHSTFQIQGFGENNCGQWCLFILKSLNDVLNRKGEVSNTDFEKIILDKITSTTF